MLQISVVAEPEQWNSKTEEFIPEKRITLHLEHSLISLAKWESKWCKPFLSNQAKHSDEETLDYIRCMTITQNVDPKVYRNISNRELERIGKYINAPMTATTFGDDGVDSKKKNTQIVTNELIYYWMIAHGIPHDYDKWHLNRLLTLIKVCEAERAPKKKRNRAELTRKYEAINAANKAKFNSKG